MAKNKIVPGPKDDHYGEPKGTNLEKLLLKMKGWAKKKSKNKKDLQIAVKARNKIKRLNETGHMTIPDPDNPGRLKIIDDLLGPYPRA